MADFGDETGDLLLRYLRESTDRYLRMYGYRINHIDKELAQEQQALMQRLKDSVGEETYSLFQWDNMTTKQLQGLVKDMESGRFVLLPLQSQGHRDAFMDLLYNENFASSAVQGFSNVVKLNRDTLGRITDRLENMDDQYMQEYVRQRVQNIRKERDALDNPVSTVVEDPIKSHDGMDIDAHSAVVESTGYDWRQDILEQAEAARQAARSEAEYIQRMEEHGYTVDIDEHGDYLYRVKEGMPVNGVAKEWHPDISGKALGEYAGRDYFTKAAIAEGTALSAAALAAKPLSDIGRAAQDMSKALSTPAAPDLGHGTPVR